MKNHFQKKAGPGPYVKICGLSEPEIAAFCLKAGADAVGLVFFPGSPRNVGPERARDVVAALGGKIPAVGVFVDASFEEIRHAARRAGLAGVQLHGAEKPGLVRKLTNEGLFVIKALFLTRTPGPKRAADYGHAHAFLMEWGKGPLPGGNAQAWDWSRASGLFSGLKRPRPLILAGGLTPQNLKDAVSACAPHAVDVSSGVESAPGRKDKTKIRAFLKAARRLDTPSFPEPPLFGVLAG